VIGQPYKALPYQPREQGLLPRLAVARVDYLVSPNGLLGLAATVRDCGFIPELWGTRRASGCKGKPKALVNLIRGHANEVFTGPPIVAAVPRFGLAHLDDYMRITENSPIFLSAAKVRDFRKAPSMITMAKVKLLFTFR
jgi:hypothetical protein